jgi:preprotein translocase subunit SecY
MEKFIILKSLKSKKMRRDVLAVLGIIIVYRFLAHVPIPLAEPSQLKQLVDGILKNQQTLGFFDILSGGALASFSIMLLGLGPYINASIIIQILSKAIPKLEERQKEGEHARKRINQYTRMITLPLAVLQSVGILVLLRQQTIASSLGIDISQNAGFSQWAVMVMSLTAGSMLLMWLGEIITEKGLANGISLVIFAGVASRLPRTAITLWSTIRGEAADHLKVFGTTLPVSGKGAAIAGAIIAFTIFLTYWVVKINEAQRIITVHYAKRVRGSR